MCVSEEGGCLNLGGEEYGLNFQYYFQFLKYKVVQLLRELLELHDMSNCNRKESCIAYQRTLSISLKD